MPNVVNNKRISLSRKAVTQYITIMSDGTQETDLVIYDNSDVCSALGILDTLTCTLNCIKFVSNSAAGIMHLEFDATTDVLALTLPFNGRSMKMGFEYFGGLKNTAGAGVTGDITLTTTGLAAGESVTIIIEARPD